MKHLQETLDEFTIIEELGFGGQAVVKLGKSKEGHFAIRIYNRGIQSIEVARNEFAILKALDHPNIIKPYDVRENSKYLISNGQNTEESECLALILEYCKGGDLFDYISRQKMFEAPLARGYFIKILSAIQHMHANKVTHRDLKASNMVLNNQFDLKIIDFGMADWIKTGKLMSKNVGTWDHLPPEYWKGECYGVDADIFASGIVLFCMVTGGSPFDNTNIGIDRAIHYKYLTTPKNKAEYWQLMTKRAGPQVITPEFKDLIERMFHLNPENRLTIEQILEHQWVKGPTYQLPKIQEAMKTRHQDAQRQAKQRRKKEMQQCYNQGWRATETEHSEEILKKIHLDPQEIDQKDIRTSDYVVNVTPREFLILLYEFLCYNKSSILCGDNAQQRFAIETEEDSNEAVVKLSYKEFDVKICVNVILRLYKTKDERTKVVFEREEDDYRLISYRLVNVLKDEFECLKTLEKKEEKISE